MYLGQPGGFVIADPEQIVLESDPYRRLAYAWNTFTPELNDRLQLADDMFAKLNSERRSRERIRHRTGWGHRQA